MLEEQQCELVEWQWGPRGGVGGVNHVRKESGSHTKADGKPLEGFEQEEHNWFTVQQGHSGYCVENRIDYWGQWWSKGD